MALASHKDTRGREQGAAANNDGIVGGAAAARGERG